MQERRGGGGGKSREGSDKGEIQVVREREKGRGACVVYDGNSCFKKKKRSGLFGVGGGGARGGHLRFLSGQSDTQFVALHMFSTRTIPTLY